MTPTHLLAVNIREEFFRGHSRAPYIADTPGDLITNLTPNLIIIAGVILLFIIIYSGYHLLSDAGSVNQQVIAKHKSMITVGIIGFLIVVASYFILQFVLATLGIEGTMNAPI